MNDLPELEGPPYGSAAGIPPPPPTDEAPRLSASGSGTPDRRHPRRRRWLRLGFVIPVVAIIAVIAFISGPRKDGSGLNVLRPGDCIVTPNATGFTKIDKVDCAQPHTQEVYATGNTSKTIATGLDAIDDPEIIRICRIGVDHRILDMLERTADASAGFLVDSSKTGRVVCTAITETRTGSIVASATRTGGS